MRPSSSLKPRLRRPCRKPGLKEAGLTCHGITAVLCSSHRVATALNCSGDPISYAAVLIIYS
jgi:hypothetical protein